MGGVLKSFLSRFLMIALKTVKWCFIVFCLFVGSLFFRSQRLPSAWVESLGERYSTSNLIVRCESIDFGFRHGLRAERVRLYDRSRADVMEPVVSAKSVSATWFFRRRVTVRDLRLSKLGDGYYDGNGFSERDRALDLMLPDVDRTFVVLLRPSILGLEPERVSFSFSVRDGRFETKDVRIDWPDLDHPMSLSGACVANLPTQRLHATVEGLATQRQIRPLIERLDIRCALPYMDAFTEVTEPVPAKGVFDVNLRNADFGMTLNLKPTLGRYNGVALANADGTIRFRSEIRGTNCNRRTEIELARCRDIRGRELSGKVAVICRENRIRLGFDLASGLDFADALDIADFLNDGTLAGVKCATPPSVTLAGRAGISAADAEANDLSGTVALAAGELYGMKVRNLRGGWRLRRDEIDFTDCSATGTDGGAYAMTAKVSVPGFVSSNAALRLNVSWKDAPVKELADFFGKPDSGIAGKTEGHVELTAGIRDDFVPTLNGRGAIRSEGGRIAQLKLFAGLTDLLSEKVPGVSALVNQSQGSCTFMLRDGVFATEDLLIEGSVFSIRGNGTYDIARDDLDFTVRVQLLRKDSILGKLVTPVTWTFSKLLMEFRVTGKLDEPTWKYLSIVDRVL